MPVELNSICVFCGSSPGRDSLYRQQATALGGQLAQRGIRLVYGGGSVGLMGTVCDAVLDSGGQVTGVLPEFLATKELRHFGVADMRVVPDMHARKALMAGLSDAFIALPGGYGTLEELLEIITWAQLGLHRAGIGLLNTGGFYDPLIQLIDQAVEAGFIRPAQRELLLVDDDPGQLLNRLAEYSPPPTEGWLRPEQT